MILLFDLVLTIYESDPPQRGSTPLNLLWGSATESENLDLFQRKKMNLQPCSKHCKNRNPVPDKLYKRVKKI